MSCIISTKSQINLTATSGSPTGYYSTVKDAFDKINDGTHQGDIVITVGQNPDDVITESAEAVLNQSGSGSASYTSVLITPGNTNITISGSLNGSSPNFTAIIQLNGAEYVTVDGRIGQTGSTVDLTIENSNTGAYSSAFYFKGASNDTLRYCNIKSSTTSSLSGCGTISFTYNSGTATSCKYNTVEYCNVTPSGSNRPNRSLCSYSGLVTKLNEYNVVRYCTFSDFTRAGIWLGYSSGNGYNNQWTINNNTFYETSTVNLTTTNYNLWAILIGNHSAGFGSLYSESNGSFIVKDNVIGGDGGTGNWSVTSNASGSSSYVTGGIFIAGSTTVYSEINGNTISNFNMNTYITNGNSYSGFNGILCYNTKAKIGSSSGNNVYNIRCQHPYSTWGGWITGIYAKTNSNLAIEIKNNNIYNFWANQGNANFYSIFGIYNTCTSTHPQDDIQNNIITNLNGVKTNYITGIYTQGYVAYNKINTCALSGYGLCGIYWNGGGLTGKEYRVENNEVILGLDSAGNSSNEQTGIYGIQINRSECNLFYNSVLLQGTANTSSSYNIYLASNATGYIVKDNLMYNDRSGGSGSHYCLSTAFTTTGYWTSSNNAYIYSSGSKASYYLGKWGSNNYSTLATWQTATGESNSIVESTVNKPAATLFPNLSSKELSVTDSWLQNGTVIAPTTDISGNPRPGIDPTTIGAYEVTNPMAVSLINFEAEIFEISNVKLHWVTSSENKNDYFIIERAVDDNNFVPLINVSGAGNSCTTINYYAIDDNPFRGTNYYRLKSIDYNGNANVSEVISINFTDKDAQVYVYPNPFTDYLTIQSNIYDMSDTTLVLYDSQGRIVKTKKIIDDHYTITLWFEELPEGFYFLKVYDKNQCSYYKLLKIK